MPAVGPRYADRRIVARGRHITLTAQITSEEEQRQAQIFRKPEVVMTRNRLDATPGGPTGAPR
jgi:hypothetical protein